MKAQQSCFFLILFALVLSSIVDVSSEDLGYPARPVTTLACTASQQELYTNTSATTATPSELSNGVFNSISKSTLCRSGLVYLHCFPEYYGSLHWNINTDNIECHTGGNQNTMGSNATLSCGTYIAECIYTHNSIAYTSGKIYISEVNFILEPNNITCMEGDATTATFKCVTNSRDVINTCWFINGKEAPGHFISSDGVELAVPCMPNFTQSTIYCQIQFKGGYVNSSAAWITVNSDPTLSTEVPAPSNGSLITIQLNPVQLGFSIAGILIAMVIVSVASILISAYVGCVNMSLECSHREKLRKCKFCITDNPDPPPQQA